MGTFKTCSNVSCKNNAMHLLKMKRYGEKCLSKICENQLISSPNVDCILNKSLNDKLYRPNILTNEELEYCIKREQRKTGLVKLKAELKKKKN